MEYVQKQELDRLLTEVKKGLLSGKEYEIKQSKDGYTVYEVKRKRIR